MTLDEAIAVLNERKHRGYDDWHVFIGHKIKAAHCSGYYDTFSEFEAIAIATAYRGAKP